MNANDLRELFEIDAEARRLGATEERDRLRPLLERCLPIIEWSANRSGAWGEIELLADLRRELGLSEES